MKESKQEIHYLGKTFHFESFRIPRKLKKTMEDFRSTRRMNKFQNRLTRFVDRSIANAVFYSDEA